jgi:ribose/xylose/arabinose/galactoside ABC-type transport system permease subunit
MTSALAGFSGVMMSSRLASGQPSMGTGFEFDVIVAVILGGTSLAGGEGTVSGSFAGALIVGIINNGLNLMGVSAWYQSVFKGVILIIAVIIDITLKGEGISMPGVKKLLKQQKSVDTGV